LELTLRGKGEGFALSASLYQSWFGNFIYELPNGETIDGLPVFQFQQNKARHYGAEFEASLRLGTVGAFTLNLDSVGDVSRTTISAPTGKLPAPRIPALRLLGGLEAQSDRLDARLETEWVDGQTRIAPFETATPGYTLVNASLNWRPWGKDRDVSLLVSANNIFDVVARRHASFLKDYAPLSGRDVRMTLRFGF
jgi:iron complex outermembrane receptor protein